jgi:hypothetical protein
MPKFNAGRFLEANDLQLVGPGESEGQLRVINSGGEEQTLNISKMLAAKGIKADEIIVNDPENAMDVSPVTLLDRAALSFGNAQGQLAYLKKNYQDAKIVDGDIRVKNKGVWQKMDASGLGDGSGWDMAKEFAKDVLDWTGEAPVIGGQLAGAAAAGGLTGGAGAIAGAGLGAGAGRGASIVMGRMLGTYEGSAQEITKDIVMDTVLSAAGEGIALGAKNMVIPKMKAAFSKISESADPAIKNQMASMLRQGAGMSEVGAYTAIKEPGAVFGVVERLQAANKGATADIITQAARQEAVDILEIGVKNSQADLSRAWRKGTADAIAAFGDDTPMDLAKPLLASINDFKLGYNILDVVPVKGASSPGIVKFAPLSPEIIAKELGIPDLRTARQIGRKLGEFTTAANSILVAQNGKAKVGKKAAQEAIEMLSKFKGVAEEIASISPDAAKAIKPVIQKMQSGIRNQFPVDAAKILQSNDSMYASNIEYVAEAMRASRTEKGVEGLLAQIKNGGTVNVPNMIESLASRRPGGESWKKAVHHRISAIEMVDSTPSGTFGAVTRPVVRGAAKAIYGSAKQAATASQMLKGMSEAARLELLKNPQAWEALSGEVMRSFNR